MYSDVLMDDPNHLRIFVPSNIELQHHLLHAYHDSSIGMHHGRDATYNSLSHDFYWRHMHKHVRNWVRHCPNVFISSPSSPSMAPCSLGFTNTLFTPLVLIMLVNFLLLPQVINGSLLQYVPTPIIFVLSQFLTKLQPLQLMPYFMMFFFNYCRFSLCLAERLRWWVSECLTSPNYTVIID